MKKKSAGKPVKRPQKRTKATVAHRNDRPQRRNSVPAYLANDVTLEELVRELPILEGSQRKAVAKRIWGIKRQRQNFADSLKKKTLDELRQIAERGNPQWQRDAAIREIRSRQHLADAEMNLFDTRRQRVAANGVHSAAVDTFVKRKSREEEERERFEAIFVAELNGLNLEQLVRRAESSPTGLENTLICKEINDRLDGATMELVERIALSDDPWLNDSIPVAIAELRRRMCKSGPFRPEYTRGRWV